jgi:uncharacterized protein
MSRRRQELTRSKLPQACRQLGPFLVAALGVFGACTTEDPREIFGTPDRPLLGGASGRGTVTAGSSGSGSTASEAGGAGSVAGTPNSGGRGGGENSPHEGGEAGENEGRPAGGTAAHAGTASMGGTSAGGGAHAGGMSGTAGTGGSGPSDTCGERPVSSGPFSKEALRAAASECAIWHYCKFEHRAAQLDQAASAHVDAPTPATLANARARWEEAMAAWSAVELFQFGPLASRAESEGKDQVHGQGLRELIYSWPRFTRCRVEEQIASERYKTGFANVPIASRGLFALEYLLFYEGSDTECAANSAAATTWAGLDSAALIERKHRYLTAVSADVLGSSRQLLELWSPSGGNFIQTFVNATGYMNEQQALTILAWSLVYMEREVKDWKLGVPLGITLMHPVNGPEAPFARTGTTNILQNLRGFRALFQGCGPSGEGLGFDDWLAEADHAQLGQDMIRAIDAAEAFASTFPPLDTATPDQLDSFYRTIKVLTDHLKSEFFGDGSPLNLDLPGGVIGDTD